MAQRSVQVWEKNYGLQHLRTATALARVARAQLALGRLEEARGTNAQVIAIHEKNQQAGPTLLVRALGKHAEILEGLVETEAAEATRARIAELQPKE
jgi:hypothetical protein